MQLSKILKGSGGGGESSKNKTKKGNKGTNPNPRLMCGNSYPPRGKNPGRKMSTIKNEFGADTTRSGLSKPLNNSRPRNTSLKGKRVMELPILGEPVNRTTPLREPRIQFPGTWITPVR